MRHHIFQENPSGQYKVAVLINQFSFFKQELFNTYVEPLTRQGVAADEIIAFTVDYNEAKKAPAGLIKDYLGKLLPALHSLGVTHLYVADSAYFKVIAGVPKSEAHQGYALPVKVKGFEHMTCVLGLNYRQLIFNPELQPKIDSSITALASVINGSYQAPGLGIIHSAHYPKGFEQIRLALLELLKRPSLKCDIEGFSLKFDKAGIGTISFAWDKHNGIAFAVDYVELAEKNEAGEYGEYSVNLHVRSLLRSFFEAYKGELTFHNAGYDVKVLVYQLWMTGLRDTRGLLMGLDIMCARLQDTKVIAYLATNSTAGNSLGLKGLAQEFAGNWALDDEAIKDIRRIPMDKLLQYNLVDSLSTCYVFDKYYPRMVADQQEELYKGLMLDSVKMLIQTELTGLPLSRRRVQEVKAKLEGIRTLHKDTILKSPAIAAVELLLRRSAWEKDFADRKGKAKNPDKIMPKQLAAFDKVTFNPNSDQQLGRLLHEVMGLPIIDKTASGAPATSADTVKKLINHTQDQAYKDVLEALIAYGGVGTILDTFVPAFEAALDAGTGDVVWIHGNFNLGGTVSGRLSSSEPNLTNIPAKVQVKIGDIKIDLGKLVKYCFISPPGWLFGGADFNSLEDMISALTTKDPNKLKVYTDGFDGHSVRAVGYWPEAFPDIDPNDPKQVNVLKKQDHPLRQESKIPTFALTYFGTWRTMVTNLGWPEDKAKSVEARYHELYKVSDAYAESRLKQASLDGYVTVAFGLRVRTPLMSQVVWGAPRMPSAAAAEGRTAGNAMGQSYCMLTMRSMVDFMKKVWASPYRYRILPVALIHDANYILMEDDIEVVEWANRELINSMRWQDLPEIQHDKVKLGAALDIFWPDWANATTLPNDADRETIIKICKAAREEFQAA